MAASRLGDFLECWVPLEKPTENNVDSSSMTSRAHHMCLTVAHFPQARRGTPCCPNSLPPPRCNMPRVPLEKAIPEGQRRLAEQRVRLKRLQIEAVLRKNPDAVLHVYDSLEDLELVGKHASNKAAGSVMPESELSKKRRDKLAHREAPREKVPSKWSTLSEVSTMILQDRIVSLAPGVTRESLDLHLTVRGRPDVTKSAHAKVLEAMVGRDPAKIQLIGNLRYVDGLQTMLAHEHGLRAQRFAAIRFPVHWPRDGIYDWYLEDEWIYARHKFLWQKPAPLPAAYMEKLVTIMPLQHLGLFIESNWSESKAYFTSNSLEDVPEFNLALLFPDPVKDHMKAICDVPAGGELTPEEQRFVPASRKRKQKPVIKQLMDVKSTPPGTSTSHEFSNPPPGMLSVADGQKGVMEIKSDDEPKKKKMKGKMARVQRIKKRMRQKGSDNVRDVESGNGDLGDGEDEYETGAAAAAGENHNDADDEAPPPEDDEAAAADEAPPPED